MYNNIGKKIKGLAKAIFILLSISTIITGMIFMSYDGDWMLFGALVLVLGPIFAWISSWFLYGFGEIIDKVSDIERNTHREINAISSTITTKTEETSESPLTTIIQKCDFCEKENTQGASCKIVDEHGTRYRNLCFDCIERNKANITIE